MSKSNVKKLKIRNISFWIVAALLYPVAHWIPTASGQPPRIFEVLIPILILGLGMASNATFGMALNKGEGGE